MSEPSFRLEVRKDGYNVYVADTRREIYPMADGTGRWMVLGWPRQEFDTPELAGAAVADRILSEVRR